MLKNGEGLLYASACSAGGWCDATMKPRLPFVRLVPSERMLHQNFMSSSSDSSAAPISSIRIIVGVDSLLLTVSMNEMSVHGSGAGSFSADKMKRSRYSWLDMRTS